MLKITPIKQKYKNDCSQACAAMISGRPIEKIHELYGKHPRTKWGMVYMLDNLGFDILFSEWPSGLSFRRLKDKNGVIYFKHAAGYHFVILNDGKIIDPAPDVENYMTLKQYFVDFGLESFEIDFFIEVFN